MVEKRPFRAYSGSQPFIFASYSHKDSAAVYAALEKLFLTGYNVWYDQGIPNNALLDMEIAKKIRGCAVFVIFLSESSVKSEYVMKKELPLARKKKKKIIYVSLDGGDYSEQAGSETVISPEKLAKALPARCRECEKRDPAPIEVDMTLGIKFFKNTPEGFEYQLVNGMLFLTDFLLTKEMEDEIEETGVLEIVIPERHEGFPICGIAGEIFSEYMNPDAGEITSIVLPDSMRSIGEGAFEAAHAEKIHLPERLKIIDCECFSECKYLEHIELPYGLETIETCAFWESEALEEIVIPETVKFIGSQAFESCSALRYAVIAPGTTELDEDVFAYLDTKDEYEEEELEDVDLDEVFHIICVEGSAAHRYAEKNSLFVKLISAGEMEEKYQRGLRTRHEQALAEIERKGREAVISGMAEGKGDYACVVMEPADRPLFEKILWKLGEDGYRIRIVNTFDSEDIKMCSTVLPLLSGRNTGSEGFVKSIVGCRKPIFPLMLDSSPVPSELGGRFILHVSDRTEDDLLNELREHLSRYGCRGNPRSEETIAEQFVDKQFDYEISSGYQHKEDNVALTKYKGNGGEVIIPDELFGKKVTSLADGLFEGRTDLTSVFVSQDVSFIGKRVFKGCTSLTSVTLPPSVENIGQGAFDDCPKKMVVYAARRSYAAKYAKENGLKLKYKRFKKK